MSLVTVATATPDDAIRTSICVTVSVTPFRNVRCTASNSFTTAVRPLVRLESPDVVEIR
jgi:hypothetical protein